MRFASVLTTEYDADLAAADLLAQIAERMEDRPIHLLVIFLSPHFAHHASMFSERLRQAFHPQALIGCTAQGVIDATREVEREPAISVLAAHLPDVKLDTFSLHDLTVRATHDDVQAFAQTLAAPELTRLYLLLADPFSTPIQAVLDAFNIYRPGVPVIGGMASGAPNPGSNFLLLNDQVYSNGAVGVALSGALSVDVIVSQGCRPIGKAFKVTATQNNMILGLDGKPPFSCVQTMVDELTEEDRNLLQNGLFIGRAIDSKQEELGRGDFLIRSVVGVDPDSGSIVVDDVLREDEIIQFHVRDAETAEEDLDMMLAPQTFYDPPCGGLLFSCNGRGLRFYDYPDGDVITIRRAIGPIAMSGFFCSGEIGPIAGRNSLHSHTASMVLFREG